MHAKSLTVQYLSTICDVFQQLNHRHTLARSVSVHRKSSYAIISEDSEVQMQPYYLGELFSRTVELGDACPMGDFGIEKLPEGEAGLGMENDPVPLNGD